MPKKSCDNKCQILKELDSVNNPKPKLLKKKGFFYHIRAMLKQDEDCLLDLWVDESLVKAIDTDELGQELTQAIQRVMDRHCSPLPTGTC